MPAALVALAAVATAAPVGEAAAQLCRGVPMRAGFAMVHRDQGGTTTGEVGVGPFGRIYVTANAAEGNAGASNGSRMYSYGGRVWYGGDSYDRDSRSGLGMCAFAGLQLGYAHLLNAEGLRANGRLTRINVPLGVALAVGWGGRSSRVMLFAIPQVALRSSSLMLYDRYDTTTTSGDRGTAFGVDLGAGLHLGPLLVRGSYFRSQGVPWTWQVSAGLSP